MSSKIYKLEKKNIKMNCDVETSILNIAFSTEN